MGKFDPDAFLHETYDESASTQETPLPEGEYQATVSKVEPPFQTANGYVIQKVQFRVEHPELEEELGRKISTARYSIFLDLTESGSLDFGNGKNVGLGRLRAALDQNEAGVPWSPSQMEGHNATIRVKHTPDKNDSEIIYTDVRGVSAPA